VPTFPKLADDQPRSGFLGVTDFQVFHEELRSLDPNIADLVAFLYITGWRCGEALGLTWERVDWEGKMLRLDVGTTKNAEGRLFPFGAHPALEELLRHRLKRTEQAQLCRGQRVPSVFHRNGRVIKDFRTVWRRACRRTGHNSLVPHDMRRSAVRNFVRAGIPERVAMRLSGHKTRSVFDRYNIVDESDLAAGVAKLSAYVQNHVDRRLQLS